MVDVQNEIDRIKSGNTNAEELLAFLESDLLLVRANALLNVAQRKLDSEEIVEQVIEMAKQEDSGKIFGTITLSRLATAALFWIGSEKSKNAYDEIVGGFSSEQKSDLNQLVNQGPNF